MKKILLTLMTLALVFGLTLFDYSKSFADTNSGSDSESIDYHQLYQEGISAGIIDSENLSYKDWTKENKEEFMPVYQEGIDHDVFENSLSYGEWIKLNNYGQAPSGAEKQQPKFSTKVVLHGGGGGYDIRAGDILITNSTSSAGILGHAAIANGDYHILDMPGGSAGNRQLTTSKWVDKYSDNGKWIKVYRLDNQTLARQVASYADTHYYSTTGSSTQNVFLDYGLTPHLYSFNPTYCSKLVFDAYYYGSGSKPVMKAPSGYVLPYGLISEFTSAYKQTLVHTYQN